MLRDVLLEVGRTDAGGRADDRRSRSSSSTGSTAKSAARMLQEALSLDPENARATQMLRELGYELVEEPDDDAAAVPDAQDSQDDEAQHDDRPSLTTRRRRSRRTTSRRSAPKTSRAARTPSRACARAAAVPQSAAMARSVDDIDDPFGASPLPSFPLESAPESEAAFELRGDAPVDRRRPIPEPELRAGPRADAQAGTPELESALEEAEFFASRGLFDDARTILDEQLARLPNHPLAARAAHGARRAGARDAGRLGDARRPRCGRRAAAREDRSFDIAESLGALDGDRASGVGPGGGRRRDRPGRRRRGLREVQGGRRRADRRRRRAEPLRPRRRLQGDGPRRRRDPRVRGRGARPEARVRLPLDDRDDPRSSAAT